MSKLTHSRLTSLDKLHALLFGHVLPEVSINVAVHVGAAGAAKCTRLSHTHPSQWNAVHLENNSASDTVITVTITITTGTCCAPPTNRTMAHYNVIVTRY